MGDDRPQTMKDMRTDASIEAAREAKRMAIKQTLVLKRDDKTPYIDLSDYKQDPVTRRYIIPYDLKAMAVPDGILYGDASQLNKAQRRALKEIHAEYEAHLPVTYKPLEETTPAERGKRVIQYNAGDIDDWLGGTRGIMVDRSKPRDVDKRQTVIFDNDWIAQAAEATSSNFWEKGGVGWIGLAHEHGHAMGLGHNHTLGTTQSVMATDPVGFAGRLIAPTSEGMTSLDWETLEMIWGRLSSDADTRHSQPDSAHPSGLPCTVSRQNLVRSRSPKARSSTK